MKNGIYPKTINSVKGFYIAITGICWTKRTEMIRLLRKKGGKVADSRAQVNKTTNLLVKGDSQLWSHKTYGEKEVKVAELIKQGQQILVIQDYDCKNLIENGKRAKIITTIAGQPLEWLLPPPSRRKFDRISDIAGSLDRDHTTKGRLEQRYLRENLFSNTTVSTCALCGRKYPNEIMIAAHIKPRSECTNKERKDINNVVFPICNIGCDVLYERGYIGINEKGKILTTKSLSTTREVKRILARLKNRGCSHWQEGNSKYFSWHYLRRFHP